MSDARLPDLLASLSNDLLFLGGAQGAIVQVGAVAQQRLAVKPDQRFGELLTSLSRPKGERWTASKSTRPRNRRGLPLSRPGAREVHR